jgi:hypothetical protein
VAQPCRNPRLGQHRAIVHVRLFARTVAFRRPASPRCVVLLLPVTDRMSVLPKPTICKGCEGNLAEDGTDPALESSQLRRATAGFPDAGFPRNAHPTRGTKQMSGSTSLEPGNEDRWDPGARNEKRKWVFFAALWLRLLLLYVSWLGMFPESLFRLMRSQGNLRRTDARGGPSPVDRADYVSLAKDAHQFVSVHDRDRVELAFSHETRDLRNIRI